MGFDVPAEDYTKFMGRFSEPLAPVFLDALDVEPGQRVLDVGCGPGALTGVLVERLGADRIAAVDPSEPFVAAARKRFPGADVRAASAEDLPFEDSTFDHALAQLVVQFMTDAEAGVAEMARVTRPGGLVAVSVWDHPGGRGPLTPLWQAAHELDPSSRGEGGLPLGRGPKLVELLESVGLAEVSSSVITVAVPFPTFEDWWQPMTLGVGPAGGYVARIDEEQRAALRERCREILPQPPFDAVVSAWCLTGRV